MSSDNNKPNSPARRGRRPRKGSSDELSIEELFPNDMAYDADCEVVYPDQYQEPDSEPEENTHLTRKWRSIDDELSARMKQLGRDRSATRSPPQIPMDRGRKRNSVEIDDDLEQSLRAQLADLEVMEVLEGRSESRPAKRRKKRTRQAELSEQANEASMVGSSASSDITDNGHHPRDNEEAMDTT